jgi:adenylate cyclase
MRVSYSYRDTHTVWRTSEKVVTIGRSKDKRHVTLDLAPDQTVSRLHARISEENGLHWIEDLSSSRGTQLNGLEIKGRGKQEVGAGANIVIGETTLQVEFGESRESTRKIKYLEAGNALPREERLDEYGATIVYAADATDGNLATSEHSPNATNRLFKTVCDLPFQLATKTTLDSLLPAVIDQLVEMIPSAESWMLALYDKRTDALKLEAYHCLRQSCPSETLLRRSMTEGKAFVWKKDADIDLSASIVKSGMETGIYAPLLWRGEALGAVCATSQRLGTIFGEQEVRLLFLVAQYAAMCITMHQLQERLRRESNIKTNLLRQFSPRVADKLLSHKGGLQLGGRRNEVTILSSDIRGFTQLARDMEPDEVVEMLNEYWRVIVPVIFAHNGTIDKFMGDAVLAVFGSPESDPKHHENAVRTALEIQTALGRLNETRKNGSLPCCGFGIGVHCGEVVHGFVGTTDRMEFTVIGDAVNRTQRYCAAASAREVLISPEVNDRVRDLAETESTTIKTKHEGDLAAYRVLYLKEDNRTIDIRIGGAPG